LEALPMTAVMTNLLPSLLLPTLLTSLLHSPTYTLEHVSVCLSTLPKRNSKMKL
jgi:hypothetical protein